MQKQKIQQGTQQSTIIEPIKQKQQLQQPQQSKQQQEQQIKQKEIVEKNQQSNQEMIEKSEGHISQNTFDLLQSQQSIKEGENQQHSLDTFSPEEKAVLMQYYKILYSHSQNRELPVKEPSEQLLYQIIQWWNNRPIVSPQNTFTLRAIYPKDQKMNEEQYIKFLKSKEDYLRQYFDASATITLFINQNQIKGRRGKIQTEGQGKIIKEGTDEFKLMYYTENATRYIGTVKAFEVEQEDGTKVIVHKYHGQGKLWQNPNNKAQGSFYNGQFKNGKKQGKGMQQSANFSSYQGDWKNNLKDGFGQETVLMRKKKKKGQVNAQKQYVVKSQYKGCFKENMRHGKGKEITPNGLYDGDWYQGLKHGEGIIKYADGSMYDGSWTDNYYHGKGKYLDKNKNQYQGEFQGGKYNGEGYMKYSSGDTYEGHWLNDHHHGQGLYTWQDGDYYDGQWKKGFADGNGTIFLNGVIYIGEFQAGKKHGQGEKTDQQGNVTRGIWHLNKLKRKLAVNEEDIPQDQQSCSEQD